MNDDCAGLATLCLPDILDMQKINIAIDGYAGCGKSTTARQVASRLGYTYIDTGAMYRAVTLLLLQEGKTDLLKPGREAELEALLQGVEVDFGPGADGAKQVRLNGVIAEPAIRSLEVSQHVSEVSASRPVRIFMLGRQQAMARKKGVVMDGRDIGTVIIPDAELKVFIMADIEARVQRRVKELADAGTPVSADDLRQNMLSRDYEDTHRQMNPLRQAPDALVLDTTSITIPQQVETVLDWAKQRLVAGTGV